LSLSLPVAKWLSCSFSTWIGGSILASLATFKKMWISRKVRFVCFRRGTCVLLIAVFDRSMKSKEKALSIAKLSVDFTVPVCLLGSI